FATRDYVRMIERPCRHESESACDCHRERANSGNPERGFELFLTRKGLPVTQIPKRPTLKAVAIAAAFAFAVAVPAAWAQKQVIVPHSNVQRPEDIGRRAHTNFLIVKEALPTTGPGPSWETPASVACIYRLVKPNTGCTIFASTAVPEGGSRSIA